MAGFVQSLGLQLLDRDKRPVSPQQLSPSDVVAFYFSAHWCPPCRQFTPLLKAFVEALEASGDTSLKVIFVSSDHSEADMWDYMRSAHGNWLAVAFGTPQQAGELGQRYGVSGIPSLVVVNQAGHSVVHNARDQVMQASQSRSWAPIFAGWRAASDAAPPSTRLAPGTRVRVRGLQSKPELNGEVGGVQGYHSDRNRYDVAFGSSVLSLKPSNLLQVVPVLLPGPSGTVAGAQEAELAEADEATGELLLRGASGEELRARLGGDGGAVLKAGTYVAVQGLRAESAQRWNEGLGRVVEFEQEKGRYLVEVAFSTRLSVRPENLRLCPLV